MAYTAKGKRCSRLSVKGQTFCATHIEEKSPIGRSRKLNAVKCSKFRKTKKSPYSNRKLSVSGRTYGQIYTVCRQRMDHLIKRLEARENLPAKTQALVVSLKKEWTRTRHVSTAKSS